MYPSEGWHCYTKLRSSPPSLDSEKAATGEERKEKQPAQYPLINNNKKIIRKKPTKFQLPYEPVPLLHECYTPP